jgi:hypothetical protein
MAFERSRVRSPPAPLFSHRIHMPQFVVGQRVLATEDIFAYRQGNAAYVAVPIGTPGTVEMLRNRSVGVHFDNGKDMLVNEPHLLTPHFPD